MDEKNIIPSKQVYDTFRNQLENNINNKKNISINNNPCYLINNNWIDEYIKKYNDIIKANNQYINNNKRNSTNSELISLQNKKPDFLNDFSSIINYLKEGKKFKLVNVEFLKFIFNENELINLNLNLNINII